MMTDMMNFCSGMLVRIADFLGSEPIIYIVSFVLLIAVFRIFKLFI